MAEILFMLCPPVPAEEGPELAHYRTAPELGFQSAHARQEIETWRARMSWPVADNGTITLARMLWEQTGEGALPMDYVSPLDGVTREMLFAVEPQVSNESAWGGRLEIELVEAL